MADMTKASRTAFIKKTARHLGFEFCGISKAEFMEEEAARLTDWLKQNRHGEMGYMENHFEKRLDPTKLVEGSKSVISLLYNYFPEKELPTKNNYKIAKYAYGTDYHLVLKKKLKEFIKLIKTETGDISGRAFVDSAPVMERQWAAKSGLGWIGKNTLLLTRERGSYYFLAELIIDLELEYDNPIGDFCGTCTRCIDACPTDALTPYRMDARKCISYLTIELRNEIPKTFSGKMNDWIFGCDICQDVCPWNRFANPHQEPEFIPKDELFRFDKREWEELNRNAFQKFFKKSAFKRTKFEGLKRNIQFVKQSSSED